MLGPSPPRGAFGPRAREPAPRTSACRLGRGSGREGRCRRGRLSGCRRCRGLEGSGSGGSRRTVEQRNRGSQQSSARPRIRVRRIGAPPAQHIGIRFEAAGTYHEQELNARAESPRTFGRFGGVVESGCAFGTRPLTRLTDEALLAGVRAAGGMRCSVRSFAVRTRTLRVLEAVFGDADWRLMLFQNTFVQVFVKIQTVRTGSAGQAVALHDCHEPGDRRSPTARPANRTPRPTRFSQATTGTIRRPVRSSRCFRARTPDQWFGPNRRRNSNSSGTRVAKLPELLRPVVILTSFQGLAVSRSGGHLEIPLGTVNENRGFARRGWPS